MRFESFYVAVVVERRQPGTDETLIDVYPDASAENILRAFAEVEAGEEAIRAFFTVYGREPGGCVTALIDTCDQMDADTLAAALNGHVAAPRLHEAIADIAYMAGALHWSTDDSREDMAQIVTWAQEFEQTRTVDARGEESYPIPGGKTDNYMTAIELFALRRIQAARGGFDSGACTRHTSSAPRVKAYGDGLHVNVIPAGFRAGAEGE